MPAKSLPVEDLRLDLQNPRIAEATNQRDALQKIINDQDAKLVELAESIVDDGLNPMDRFLVIASPEEAGKFIAIEGNRRLAAIKILRNPSMLTGMEVRPSIQKRFETLATGFDSRTIEPLDCFEVAAREDGASWIQQRHTGENAGRGIVDWSGVATARFRGNDPALQALDFVIRHGGFTNAEKEAISARFPISTLDRLLSTPKVRDAIGVETKGGKLLTGLPFAEVLKPLKRIVRDLASGEVNVTKLKLQPQMVAYVDGLDADLPDLSLASTSTVPVEDLTAPGPSPSGGTGGGGTTPGSGGSGGGGSGSGSAGGGGATGGGGAGTTPPIRKPRTPIRRALIPKTCSLNVTNSKVAEIEKELRALPFSDYPHAIAVLLRVFLELSVDHYLRTHSIPLDISLPGGRTKWKDLGAKVDEAVAHMVAQGVPTKELDGIRKGIKDQHNPLYVHTLHNYVHNGFYSPKERDLTVAWDNAQPFFERLWP